MIDWIYEVYVRDLKAAYDEESPFDPNWTESYWGERASAIQEAKRLYKRHNEWQVVVFARRINVCGKECDTWIDENHKMVFSIQKGEVATFDEDGNFVE